MESILFYTFAAITLISGILFMASKKIVHAVFYSFIFFITLSGVFLILDAPFIAAAQIFIYGGAITVLILFVVMVTVTDIHGVIKNNQNTMGFLAATLFGSVLVFVISATKWPVAKVAGQKVLGAKEMTDKLAETLFTVYYFPFEAAGVLLLAALVGAIYLAREKE